MAKKATAKKASTVHYKDTPQWDAEFERMTIRDAHQYRAALRVYNENTKTGELYFGRDADNKFVESSKPFPGAHEVMRLRYLMDKWDAAMEAYASGKKSS